MNTLTKPDRQRILHKVWHHFVTRRQPAGRTVDADCAYHAGGGRDCCCAIGLFDAERRLTDEPLAGFQVDELARLYPATLSRIFGKPRLVAADVAFLTNVQEAHDNAVLEAFRREDANPASRSDACFVEAIRRRLIENAEAESLRLPAAVKPRAAQWPAVPAAHA